MSSLVYVVREPVQTLSAALFPPDPQDWTVVAVERALGENPSSPVAEVVSSGTVGLARGHSLTYRELLELVIESGKAITL